MSKTRKPKDRPVKFIGDEGSSVEVMNTGSAIDELRQRLGTQDPNDPRLAKTVNPRKVDPSLLKKVDQSKVAFSAHELTTIDGVEVKGWRRIFDEEQKELSQIDPYISAIIATRCSQGAVCGRPSASKYDKGTRIREIKPLKPKDFENREEFSKAQAGRQAQMERIMSWALNCGMMDQTILDTVFAGQDKMFKHCSLSDFITAQIRNLMTFGRMGSQIFRDKESGQPMLFRPVPIETIGNLKDQHRAPTMGSEETSHQSVTDGAEYDAIPEGERPKAYAQTIEGRKVNFFTEDDLKVAHFQKQALYGLNGYPLSPIEQAIYMVFIHQQTLGYLRNQFVKGLAAKGILVIRSTEPSGQLSEEDLSVLRQQFNNYANRNDNSASVPVLSGAIEVDFKPLSPTPRDMEFLQIEEHVIRALCSSFQISPQEMGYGHLSIGQGSATQANKQEEIIRGEERGLRMLLDIIYDQINEVLYENFPEAEKLYRIEYVGVGEDTRDAAIARQQQEIQTTATLSSLWADSEKLDVVPYGGDIPLSPAWFAGPVQLMRYGFFAEHYLGEEDASQKPEYDFIIGQAANAAYQQLRAQPIQQQQEGGQLQLEAEKQQLQQGQMAQEMAAQQDQQGQGEALPAEGEQQPEPEKKSLTEAWEGRQRLTKSSDYFKAWSVANETLD